MARKQTPMKRCTKSGKMFPATPEFFYRDKSQKDGLSPWSKDAEKAYNKAYYAALKKAKANRASDLDEKKRKVFAKAMQSERVERTVKATAKSTKKATAHRRARTNRKNALKATNSA